MKYLIALLLLPVSAFAQSFPIDANALKNGSGTLSIGTLTSSIYGNSKPDFTTNADTFDGTVKMTIIKSKVCAIVILEDNFEKIVLGCRKELK